MGTTASRKFRARNGAYGSCMIHARIDLSCAREKTIGTFHPDGITPEIWFMAEGVTIPEKSDEIPETENEESLLLCLSVEDAASLATLLAESILACINGRRRVN
jgi:hypothetical protein